MIFLNEEMRDLVSYSNQIKERNEDSITVELSVLHRYHNFNLVRKNTHNDWHLEWRLIIIDKLVVSITKFVKNVQCITTYEICKRLHIIMLDETLFTENHKKYNKQFKNWWRGLSLNDIISLHDNTRSHAAGISQQLVLVQMRNF